MLLGIDEVGRGCWAGPLVAGAVVLRQEVDGLRDSKKLTKKRRDILALEIQEKAFVGLGWVWPDEIDQWGLTKSVQYAMLRAVKDLHLNGGTYDEIIIDGNYNFLNCVNGLQCEPANVMTMVRADDSVPAVSAASIVAKVARDNYMIKISEEYPQYAFDKNVGYGAPAHTAALKVHGVTSIHRISYKPVKACV